jgi:hypothetical protein
MKASGAVIVGVGVVFFGKVPTAHDPIVFAEAFAQGLVVVGNAAVNHGHGLPTTGEAIGVPHMVQPGALVGFGQGGSHLSVLGQLAAEEVAGCVVIQQEVGQWIGSEG